MPGLFWDYQNMLILLCLYLGFGIYLVGLGNALWHGEIFQDLGVIIPGVWVAFLLLILLLRFLEKKRNKPSFRVFLPTVFLEIIFLSFLLMSGIIQIVSAYQNYLLLWQISSWINFLSCCVFFLFSTFFLPTRKRSYWNQFFVSLFLFLSTLLPAFAWLIGLALLFPEDLLGEPGRFHHIGLSYGQMIIIGLGFLWVFLYKLGNHQFLSRRFYFISAVSLLLLLPSVGFLLLTVIAHPMLAFLLGFLSTFGALLSCFWIQVCFIEPKTTRQTKRLQGTIISQRG